MKASREYSTMPPFHLMMQTQDDGSIVANIFIDEVDNIDEVVSSVAKHANDMFAAIAYAMDDTVLIQYTPVVKKFSLSKGGVVDE
ncbi:MAG: hypothetical protein QXH07_07120 [Thermoplasmata archaeon]